MTVPQYSGVLQLPLGIPTPPDSHPYRLGEGLGAVVTSKLYLTGPEEGVTPGALVGGDVVVQRDST